VISALANPSAPQLPAFMTDATRNALTVMEEQGISRIIVTSGVGAGDDWAHLNPAIRALVSLSPVMRYGYADHHGVDRAVRASGADWTLARAVVLTSKPGGRPIRAAERGTARPGHWLTRADLATFLLDTAENHTWTGKAPLVWNTGR
jgi:hypothetical protein